jgi:hypothetical protein
MIRNLNPKSTTWQIKRFYLVSRDKIHNNILSRVRGSVTNKNGFLIKWFGFIDIFYSHGKLKSITTAHSRWLPRTRSIPYWNTSVFSSAMTDLVLIYESVTSSVSVVRWLILHSWTLNPNHLLTFLPNSLPNESAGSINYVSSFCNFWRNRIEITISNISRYCCRGNGSGNPLLSNWCSSTVDSITFGTCLRNCCLSMVIFVTICR